MLISRDRPQQVRRAHRHRPRLPRHARSVNAPIAKVARDGKVENGPAPDQAADVPRPRTDRGRGSDGRRHRLRLGHRGPQHRRHDRRRRRARGHHRRRGRRADRLDVLHGQQLAVRRTRRQVAHLAPDSRALDARAGIERRAARRRYRQRRHVRSARPRRTASLDPDRDDAPRRLRNRGLQAAGHHHRTRRQEDGAGRVRRRRRARKSTRARSSRRSANARAIMSNMVTVGESRRLEYTMPTRAIFGLRGELLTLSRGTAVMSHTYYDHQPLAGEIPGRGNGALVASETGTVTAYALAGLEQRGRFFVGTRHRRVRRHGRGPRQRRQRRRDQRRAREETHQHARRRHRRKRAARPRPTNSRSSARSSSSRTTNWSR